MLICLKLIYVLSIQDVTTSQIHIFLSKYLISIIMKNKKTEDKVSLVQKAVLANVNKLEQHLSRPVTEEEYIHRIRVDVKRLRGWLRVLRYRDENCDWKVTDQHIHDLSRALGGTRDAEVLQETLSLLRKFAKDKHDKAIVELLQEKLHVEVSLEDIDWGKIKTALLDELIQYKNYHIYCKNINDVKKGLKHLYKRALQYGNVAFSHVGTFDELHELRKWVKYLNYQIAFIRKAYPKSLGNYKKEISELGDSLGKIHDMVVLKERIKDNIELSVANELIDKMIEHLINKARHLYHSLFKYSPKRFIEEIQ